ncbi:hypothetical protein [Dactylosporangium sp. NPDC049140]|uniref:hypothetical protein n=1 Tax=Dactylosporangium sp. NPDC049140 TaxID=3155647 RepID=UPI0033E6AD95
MRTHTSSTLRYAAIVFSVVLPLAVAGPAPAAPVASATPVPLVDCFGNLLPVTLPGLPSRVIYAQPGAP